MNDSDANVTCGPSGSRRLPVRSGVSQTSGSGTTLRRLAPVRDGVHVRRRRRAAARRLRPAHAGELRDQHRVVLVVAEMIVIGGARVVVERDEVALRVERAAHLERVRRALRVPRRFFLPHPLHAHRPADLLRQKRRLEPGIVGRRAAVGLRPVHPDDADAIARHLQELGDAVAQPVRLHVVRVDRQLIVRRDRPSRAPGRAPCGPGTARRIGLDDRGGAGKRRVGIADDGRRAARRRRRAAHVRRRDRRRSGTAPSPASASSTLSCARRANRLLLALADDRDVVALAHDLDEPGNAAHRRFVDADERRAGHRRLHVARVHHAGQLHVDGPLQRAVHLGRNVVALRRLPDDLQLLHRS